VLAKPVGQISLGFYVGAFIILVVIAFFVFAYVTDANNNAKLEQQNQATYCRIVGHDYDPACP
jgi:large-conductance mechanosensitive channel